VNQQPVLHLVDVRCAACGTSFAVRSTAQAISVEVCSTCHPAYTGRERTTVSGGRVDRFNKRRALAAA
jgi:large subunit ribosomal protein L31